MVQKVGDTPARPEGEAWAEASRHFFPTLSTAFNTASKTVDIRQTKGLLKYSRWLSPTLSIAGGSPKISIFPSLNSHPVSKQSQQFQTTLYYNNHN